MDRQVVAEEMKFLLALVRDVESNDQLHAVQTLTSRKAALTQLTEDDTEVDAEALAEAVVTAQSELDDAKAEETTAQEAVDALEDDADADAVSDANDALTAATEAVATKQTALDEATDAVE